MKSVLDSRQMLAAKTLAITGSFTLAGRYLSLTQSAVSHAIKALEDEVGCRLFVRTGKGVVVTPAGKHFLQHLDRILEQMEIARTLVSPRTAAGKECLRVGISTRARDIFLPVVRPAFQKEFPNRLVLMEPGDYRDSLELLESGLIDLSFSVQPVERPHIAFCPLFEDELRFVVSSDHPWARRGVSTLDDLDRGMLLVHQAYNNTQFLLASHLHRAGIDVRHAVELVDYQHVRNLVLTGQCVGVLPPWLIAPEIASGAMVTLPIGKEPLVRHWGLAYDRKRTLAPIDQRFIELCRQAVPDILSRLLGRPVDSLEKKVPLPRPFDVRLSSAVVAVAGMCVNWACYAIEWSSGTTEVWAACG